MKKKSKIRIKTTKMFFKTPFLIHFWSKTTFNPKNQLSLRIFSQPDYYFLSVSEPAIIWSITIQGSIDGPLIHGSNFNPLTKNDPSILSDQWTASSQWIKDLWTTNDQWTTINLWTRTVQWSTKWSTAQKWSMEQKMIYGFLKNPRTRKS